MRKEGWRGQEMCWDTRNASVHHITVCVRKRNFYFTSFFVVKQKNRKSVREQRPYQVTSRGQMGNKNVKAEEDVWPVKIDPPFGVVYTTEKLQELDRFAGS